MAPDAGVRECLWYPWNGRERVRGERKIDERRNAVFWVVLVPEA